MQKIFVVSGTLFLIVLVLWGVYEWFFRSNQYTPTVNNSDIKVAQQPVPKKDIGIFSGEPVQVVIDERVVSAALDSGDTHLWYVVASSNVLLKKDVLSGSVETVMTFAYTPNQIRFSPDFSKALVQERSLVGEKWHMVNLQTKTDTPLKEGLKSPVWTNTGDRIVYEYDVAKDFTINLALPDGSDWKKLTNVASSAVAISTIPKTSLIAVWNIPSAFSETKLQTLSLAGGDPQLVFIGRFGADYLFSPDGTKMLVSSVDQKGGGKLLLGTANMSGGEYRTLDAPTLTNKTVWGQDSKTVYFTLPGGFPDGVVLPDDYKQKPVYSTDAFWKVDTTTGKKDRIVDLADLKQGFDATRLFLDSQERYLFFINRYDGKLYRVKV